MSIKFNELDDLLVSKCCFVFSDLQAVGLYGKEMTGTLMVNKKIFHFSLPTATLIWKEDFFSSFFPL